MVRRFVALVALVVALAASTAAQAPSGENKQQPGSVSGHVTVDGKSAPGVVVRLQKEEYDGEQRRPLTATTDSEGEYEFENVPPDRYVVSPYAPGLSGPNVGWGGVGSRITVAPGDEIEGVDVALRRGGVITGRITDGDGRPIVEQPVHVLAINDSGAMEPIQLPNMHLMRTDDRGIYRIYGIPPGQYYVAVGKVENAGMWTGYGRDLAKTFYTSPENEGEAKEIAVESGSEAAGIDITVVDRTTTFTARGRIVAPKGMELKNYQIIYGTLAEGQRSMNFMGPGGSISSSGEFRIEGLAPGRYSAMVYAGFASNTGAYSDVATFEITDADVSGLEIGIHLGTTISGVLVMENPPDAETAKKLKNFRLFATPIAQEGEESVSMFAPSSAEIAEDGSFTITGIRPRTIGLALTDYEAPKGFSIVRIERDGVEVPNSFAVTQSEPIAGLRVVIGSGTGIVRGHVVFKNEPMPKGYTLYVIANRTGSGSLSRWFAVDERGQFLIDRLTPGDYELSLRATNNATYKTYEFLPAATQSVSVSNGGSVNAEILVDLSVNRLVEAK